MDSLHPAARSFNRAIMCNPMAPGAANKEVLFRDLLEKGFYFSVHHVLVRHGAHVTDAGKVYYGRARQDRSKEPRDGPARRSRFCA